VTPEQEKRKDAYLRRVHGISLDQYSEILKWQNGSCATCSYEPKTGEYLTVDHDHGSKLEQVTPFVRGLLCRGCNRFLVGRHRDGNKLIRAGQYLLDPPAKYILPENHKYPQKKRQPRKRKRNGGRVTK
jgi:hypothetical protein